MGKRYIIKTRSRYYVERDKYGRFKKWIGIGKSLAADRRKKAKKTVQSGHGNQGDQKKRRK